MHGYRAYIIGQDGRIQDRIEFFCNSDEEAKERAKQRMDPDQARAEQALVVVTLSTASLVACFGLLISML
jgi:hypothetical protein